MYLRTQPKNGISALELKRQLGISYKAAWRMKHKLLQVMKERDDKSHCLASSGLMTRTGAGNDYKRNATSALFAALNLLTGEVLGQCAKHHRHTEWLGFLRLVNKNTPAEKEAHIFCDNYAAHKHPKIQSWLKYHKRHCQVMLAQD
jgi:hypothetical protein